LDDLFNRAEELWNSIQGTSDKYQQVVVDATMAIAWRSDLDNESNTNDYSPPIDSLIYNPPMALKSPATFVGSKLSITGPNFHIFPVQPNYQVQWDGLGWFIPSADDATGVFYFSWGDISLIAVTLRNLRLVDS
jgi:hypothetical protein